MANYCSLTSFMVWRLKKLQQTRNMVFHHDMYTFKWTKVTGGGGGCQKNADPEGEMWDGMLELNKLATLGSRLMKEFFQFENINFKLTWECVTE